MEHHVFSHYYHVGARLPVVLRVTPFIKNQVTFIRCY